MVRGLQEESPESTAFVLHLDCAHRHLRQNSMGALPHRLGTAQNRKGRHSRICLDFIILHDFQAICQIIQEFRA